MATPSSGGGTSSGPYSYDLFSLKKLLSFGSVADGAGVEIMLAAHAGCNDHLFLAFYLSNDTLVLRYSSTPSSHASFSSFTSSPAVVKVIRCSHGTALLLVCADMSVVVLPVHLLLSSAGPSVSLDSFPRLAEAGHLLRRVESTSSDSSRTPEKEGGEWDQVLAVGSAVKSSRKLGLLRTPTYKADGATACLWWRTGAGQDVFVIGTRKGRIHFVDAKKPEQVVTVELKSAERSLKRDTPQSHIVGFQLVAQLAQPARYLLVTTQDGGCWRFVVERLMARGNVAETVMTKSPQTAFLPERLSRFPPPCSVHYRNVRGMSHICVFDSAAGALEIYSSDFDKYPLFVHQLPSRDVDRIHFTDKFTFGFCRFASSTSTISEPYLWVISNHVSGTTGSAARPLKHRSSQSVMQTILLPAHEPVLGVFEEPRCGDPDHATEPGGGHPRLEGFYIYTRTGVYRCQPAPQSAQVFVDLVEMGLEKSLAEPLGNTLGLDMLDYYERLADQQFELKNYGRALDLYYLSNVDTAKLAAKYLAIDRIDIVLTHLRTALYNPAALSVSERKRFSNLMLGCFIQRQFFLTSQEDKHRAAAEYSDFILANPDFDIDFALRLLGSINSSSPFNFSSLLGVAIHRQLTSTAVTMLKEHGRSLLGTRHDLDALTSDPSLSKDFPFELLLTMPPEYQLKIIASLQTLLPCHLSLLFHTLPSLEPAALGRFLAANHPTSLSIQSRIAMSSPLAPRYFELYLYGLLLFSSTFDLPPSHHHPHDSSLSSSDISSLQSSSSDNLLLASEGGGMPTSPASPIETYCARLVACGGNHMVVVDRLDRVFGFGPHECGDRCTKNDPHISHSFRIPFPISKVRVDRLACGTAHSLAIDSRGNAWAWGIGNYGQLGIGKRVDFQRDPVLVSIETAGIGLRNSSKHFNSLPSISLPSFLAVDCGDSHSALVCRRGTLWTFGSNRHGQLGLAGDTNGSPSKDVLSPCLVRALHGEIISSVGCGFGHTVALSEAGHVYSWGSGMYGQLGHGNKEDVVTPMPVTALQGKRIRAIACGSFHTIALTDLDNLYSWGRGSYSRLGHGDIDDQPTPRLIDFLMGKTVSACAAGYQHSLALASDSLGILSWGCNDQGQLGHGDFDAKLLPSFIGAFSEIRFKSISSGESFSAGLTEENQVYVWGSNDHGQLGVTLPPGASADPGFSQPLLLSFPQMQFSKAPQLLVRLSQRSSSVTSLSNLALDASFFHPDGSLRVSPINYARNFEDLLQTCFPLDRPRFLIHTLQANGLYHSAALLFDLLHAPHLSLLLKLQDLLDLQTKVRALSPVPSQHSTSQLIPEAFHVLGAAFHQKDVTPELQSDLLCQTLLFLHQFAPEALADLESLLIGSIDTMATPLLDLLRRYPGAFGHPQGPFPFSHHLFIKATNSVISRMHSESLELMGVPKHRLWTEIRDNLTKHLETSSRRRDFIRFPSAGIKSIRRDSNSPDILMFSCEHAYPRTQFLYHVLRDSQDKFGVKEGLEVFTSLTQADYHLPFINMACLECGLQP